MTKRDYYDVLGVSKNAADHEIKSAYRKLAKKYHPDTNQGDQYAEQQFKEVQDAYEVLSDPEKKKLYDRFGFAAFDSSMNSGGGQGGFSDDWKKPGFGSDNGGQYTEYHFEGDDIFGSMFDDLFGNGFPRGKNRQKKGRNIQSEITISFEEAAFGCSKKLYFSGGEKAPIEVHIPAGIDEGQNVRLRGLGYPGSGGMEAGDLLLKVHIEEKIGYERKGMDVYTTESIPYTTAALGGETVFHTLYGNVKCQIPAGTQSGSKIRLRQKGIVSMKDSNVHGDAYVTIQIAVPKNITAEEKRKLQELQQIQYDINLNKKSHLAK